MIINTQNNVNYIPRNEQDCDLYVQITDNSLDPWYPQGTVLGFMKRCCTNNDAIVLVDTPDQQRFVVAYDDNGFDFYNEKYDLRYPEDDIKIIGVMECAPIYTPINA